jgi:hypothetical protein
MLLRSRRTCILWGATALLAGLVGCKSWFGPKGMPDDPLFLSRAPLEVQAKSAPPTRIVYSEPAMPVRPCGVVEELRTPTKQESPIPTYVITIPPIPADVK